VLHPQFVEKSVKAAQARKLGAQFDTTVDQGPQVRGQVPMVSCGFSVGRAISGTNGENDVGIVFICYCMSKQSGPGEASFHACVRRI
jgi:hypothetical protein